MQCTIAFMCEYSRRLSVEFSIFIAFYVVNVILQVDSINSSSCACTTLAPHPDLIKYFLEVRMHYVAAAHCCICEREILNYM